MRSLWRVVDVVADYTLGTAIVFFHMINAGLQARREAQLNA